MVTSRVFLSSAPADALLCEALVGDLRAAGADVWYDPQGAGSTEHELATRASFVVVLSPMALRTQQVRFEMASALLLARSGAIHKLVAVLVAEGDLPPAFASFVPVTLEHAPTAGPPPDRSPVLAALGLLDTPTAHTTLVPYSAPDTYPSAAVEPIVLPPQLASLGYTGWHILNEDVILPPLSLVESATFVMGNESLDAAADERPAHTVTLARYAITTFPVTVAEYACFVGAGHPLPPDMGRVTWSGQFSRLDHPVVNVSWHDANAYAIWLATHTGGRWRLPSEAEWECAARWDPVARHMRVYPWGDQFDLERCNIRESTIATTTPIHLYPNGASPCGAREMAGNVREWVNSRYVPYPYTADDGREYHDEASMRVQRGGSWFDFASEVRAAARYGQPLGTISPYVGFRLVLEGNPPIPRT